MGSYLEYTFSAAGTYYLGVSAYPNINYSAVTGDGDLTPFNSGGYTLTLINNPWLMMASSAGQGNAENQTTLTAAELGMIVEEAVDRWAEWKVVDENALRKLENVTFQIVDLSGLALGQTTPDTILIDVNAAGHGWYVDQTPGEDLEFGVRLNEVELAAISTSPAFGRMDLLTVVMHELGHVLGYGDLDPNAQNLMSGTLDAGTRRLNDSMSESPNLVQMDRVPGGEAERASMLWGSKQGQGSWLEDFLVNGAGKNANPFDPTDRIKISIPGNIGGGNKKLH